MAELTELLLQHFEVVPDFENASSWTDVMQVVAGFCAKRFDCYVMTAAGLSYQANRTRKGQRGSQRWVCLTKPGGVRGYLRRR